MTEQQMFEFTQFFNRMPGLWWIRGLALIHWITHQELSFGSGVNIAVTLNKDDFENYCRPRNVTVECSKNIAALNMGCGVKCTIELNATVDDNIIASENEKAWLHRRSDLTDSGLWRRKISKIPDLPYQIQVPFRLGNVLDNFHPLWWQGLSHGKRVSKDVWFTQKRKESGYELLGLMLERAECAGIRDAMWLGFGNLLGYVRHGDFCPNDNDMDMCIMMDKSTPEKDRKYLEEIKKPFELNGKRYPHGLCETMFRFSNFKEDENRPLWISIGHRSIEHDNGVKSCHWWMFEHSNHYWHSKGDLWVQPGKFHGQQLRSSDKAACLGQPVKTLDGFVEVDFHGNQVNMPKNAGACLDWWYPGWDEESKGPSSKKRILAIGDWRNKSTWRMM